MFCNLDLYTQKPKVFVVIARFSALGYNLFKVVYKVSGSFHSCLARGENTAYTHENAVITTLIVLGVVCCLHTHEHTEAHDKGWKPLAILVIIQSIITK